MHAARLMIAAISEQEEKGNSFALETTLSGKRYLRLIPDWQNKGYIVELIFLELPNVELAVHRVAARVAQGGHHIPEAIIRRRFSAGLDNFHKRYKPLVDVWLHYDNSGDSPKLIDWSER